MRTGFKRVVIAEPEHEIAIAKAWKGPVVRAGGVVVEGLSALARRAGKNAEWA